MSTSSSDAKNKEKMNCYNGPDRLSDLPDVLLLHILSFLDFRYVISTSLLSRRWRFLWTCLRFLNFSDEVYNDCKSLNGNVDQNALKIDFTDFVHRVLSRRDTSFDISSFRFSYTVTEIEIDNMKKDEMKLLGDIYLCILVLLRSNHVQVIDLRINSLPEQLNLPRCLFNSKSLTTLKLDMEPEDIDVGPVQSVFKLPTDQLGTVNLPALRVLLLRSLSIEGDVGTLISSCPVLESFIISKCSVKFHGRELNITASQLKMFVIDEVEDDRSETDWLPFCKVKVFAPELTSFISKSATMNDYTFVDNSSLVNADLDIDENAWVYYYCYGDVGETVQHRLKYWRQEWFKSLIKFFSGISNVRSLTISAWLLTMIVESQAPGVRSLPVDAFCNMRILNLKASLWKHEIHGIRCLLDKCPALETLVLTMVEFEDSVRNDDAWDAELEPQCMMDHLKIVEICDMTLTCVNELEFLKFLLENATILEKMIVHTAKEQSPMDNIKLKRFRKELKRFPASSSMTRISFLSDAKPRRFRLDEQSECDADL